MTTALIVLAICIVVFLLLVLFAPKLVEPFLDIMGDVVESMFDD